jgi:hypothetical protein
MKPDRWETDGDWMEDPWFTREEFGLLREAGFDQARRRELVPVLARLYPPDVCREVREDIRAGFGGVIALFYASVPHLVPLLEVARDLAVVDSWDDGHLIKRLRRRREFANAAFELRVLANLRRGAYLARRVPENPVGRSPDLTVRIGSAEYEVEVKSLDAAALDRFADRVADGIFSAQLHLPGMEVELLSSNEFEEAVLDAPDAELPSIDAVVSAYTAAVERARLAGVPGEFPAVPYGRVVVRPTTHGDSVAPRIVPDLSPEKRCARALRLIRDAGAQFSSRSGIVLLEVAHRAEFFDVEAAVQNAARYERRGFSKIHMVVLTDEIEDPRQPAQRLPVVLPVQVHSWRPLTNAQIEFACVAGGGERQKAALVRKARPGEPAVAIDTRRPRSKLMPLGELKGPLKPGAGMTIRMFGDGRPPEVTYTDPEPEHAEPSAGEEPGIDEQAK